jgi:hypothetical protein
MAARAIGMVNEISGMEGLQVTMYFVVLAFFFFFFLCCMDK